MSDTELLLIVEYDRTTYIIEAIRSGLHVAGISYLNAVPGHGKSVRCDSAALDVAEKDPADADRDPIRVTVKLELTRFGGHHSLFGGGVHNGRKDASPVSPGISAADG